MNNFTKGVLLGVGIGLLIAPMRGEELRQVIRQRFETLRARLPENEQINKYAQQLTDRVSETGSVLKDYAQQAATKVKSTSSDLLDLAQQAGTAVKQTGQDVIETTKQAGQDMIATKQTVQ